MKYCRIFCSFQEIENPARVRGKIKPQLNSQRQNVLHIASFLYKLKIEKNSPKQKYERNFLFFYFSMFPVKFFCTKQQSKCIPYVTFLRE